MLPVRLPLVGNDAPVTVITGARKGIGRALAEHYVAKGHTVVGCSREAPDTDVPYHHIIADVSDEVAVRELFLQVRRRFGRVDHAINNAGVAVMNHSILTPASTVTRVLAVNTLGTFLVSREAAKHMRRAKTGRIVNFSTVAVPLSLEGEAAYVAAKAGVESLTKVLAREFGSFGVTVNAVGPGPIATDLIRGVAEEKIDAIVQRQAIQRLGTFEDVINVVDFFLSPHSSLVTGQIVYLGGV